MGNYIPNFDHSFIAFTILQDNLWKKGSIDHDKMFAQCLKESEFLFDRHWTNDFRKLLKIDVRIQFQIRPIIVNRLVQSIDVTNGFLEIRLKSNQRLKKKSNTFRDQQIFIKKNFFVRPDKILSKKKTSWWTVSRASIIARKTFCVDSSGDTQKYFSTKFLKLKQRKKCSLFQNFHRKSNEPLLKTFEVSRCRSESHRSSWTDVRCSDRWRFSFLFTLISTIPSIDYWKTKSRVLEEKTIEDEILTKKRSLRFSYDSDGFAQTKKSRKFVIIFVDVAMTTDLVHRSDDRRKLNIRKEFEPISINKRWRWSKEDHVSEFDRYEKFRWRAA